MRLLATLLAAVVATAILASTAVANDRMWMGFHDDPVLRYEGGRQAQLTLAAQNGRR